MPLIVGMGKAAELARKHLPDYEKKVRPLRDALEARYPLVPDFRRELCAPACSQTEGRAGK